MNLIIKDLGQSNKFLELTKKIDKKSPVAISGLMMWQKQV